MYAMVILVMFFRMARHLQGYGFVLTLLPLNWYNRFHRMITLSTVRKLAFTFEEVQEQPHFEKISFRINKKIFATVDTKKQVVVLKLSEIDQSVFSDSDRTAVYPVPGAWGRQGWTKFEMKKVRKDLFSDALTTSYCNVAPSKLAEKYRIQ